MSVPPAAAFIPDTERETEVPKSIHDHIRVIYSLGAIIMVALWAGVVGWRDTFTTPLGIGALLGFIFMGIGLGFASYESVGSYAAERGEASRLNSAAFPIVMSLFSMGSLMMNVDREVAKSVVPFLMLSLVFSIMLVIPPVWLPTTNSRHVIYDKHIRSTFFYIGLSFAVGAMLKLFFHPDRPAAQTLTGARQAVAQANATADGGKNLAAYDRAFLDTLRGGA